MKKVIALTLALVILVSVAIAEEENGVDFYPLLTVVVEVDVEEDVVICLDKFGDEWAFYGVDFWCVGDLCNLLMFNNGGYYTEHEIIDVYWEGHFELDELIRFIENWEEEVG